jgi:hypothetical protein
MITGTAGNDVLVGKKAKGAQTPSPLAAARTR